MTLHAVLEPAVTNINTKTIFKCEGNSNFNETYALSFYNLESNSKSILILI